MNVDDLALMIDAALDAAGKTKIPVVPPGTPISVLPAVVLAPSDDELGDGNRSLREGINIVCLVPRSSQVAQYPLLCELRDIVIRSLRNTQVQFDGPIVFASTGGPETGEPPALSKTIPVTFAADVDLC